ncbi:hypothetical protein FGO68_gene13823 [Halteria grandinella]|uniref:Uncharacterized protein n=1 Tax=Halteria grandinella TaxID=5974 RepID=A0A8J8NMK2_HALGN|nr:hypothetical protein FGO68_gene13823 [Halteria grandinella]
METMSTLKLKKLLAAERDQVWPGKRATPQGIEPSPSRTILSPTRTCSHFSSQCRHGTPADHAFTSSASVCHMHEVFAQQQQSHPGQARESPSAHLFRQPR